ncbi:MAG: hypothetical protein QUS09_09610, partial [Methanotrichaceae archaeon]|nr:hypothetical protein [Methanotrichaceae archaeon]
INNQQLLQNSSGMPKVRETVKSGLRLFEALGIGGMNTRGMGRLKCSICKQEGNGEQGES